MRLDLTWAGVDLAQEVPAAADQSAIRLGQFALDPPGEETGPIIPKCRSAAGVVGRPGDSHLGIGCRVNAMSQSGGAGAGDRAIPRSTGAVAVHILARGGIQSGAEGCRIHAADQVAALAKARDPARFAGPLEPRKVRLIVEAGLDLGVELVPGNGYMTDGTLGRDGGVSQRGTGVHDVTGCRASRPGLDEI